MLGLGGEERRREVLLPVTIQVAIEAQGAETHQGHAGLLAPVHACPFLAAGDQEVVGLFRLPTPDVLAVTASLTIVGQIIPTGLNIGDEVVQRRLALDLGAEILQKDQGSIDLSAPEQAGQRAQEIAPIGLGAAEPAGGLGARAVQVLPIQDHGRRRQGSQDREEEGTDPARTIPQEQHGAIRPPTEQGEHPHGLQEGIARA